MIRRSALRWTMASLFGQTAYITSRVVPLTHLPMSQKDGVVVIWHDEVSPDLTRNRGSQESSYRMLGLEQNIDGTKCLDTQPVVPDDPDFPYVGKYIANLTLAQVKTLDCGSQRLAGFPLQLTVPGTKIATLQEMFDFVKVSFWKALGTATWLTDLALWPSKQCATDEPILFNIESKVDGDFRNLTRSPEDFVNVSPGRLTPLAPRVS